VGNVIKTTSVFKKPEFWASVVTSVSGLLLAFGIITPDQAKGVNEYVPNIIGALLSLLSTMKFIGAQTTAKIEVFRAMCTMQIERNANGGNPTAQGVSSTEDEIGRLAKASGL